MQLTKRSHYCLGIALLVCFVPVAFGQQVTLHVNNPPGNNVLNGIYVGPYSTTNVTTGGSLNVICDDFKDESNYSPATFTVNTFSSLGNTLWGASLLKAGDTLAQVTTLYEDAAWLAEGMLSQSGAQQGYYSYALWAVFDTTDVAKWLTSQGTAGAAACNAVFGSGAWSSGTCTPAKGSGGLLALAEGQQFSPGQFANVTILTPNGCTNGPGTCPEQEFLVVPEGGTAAAYLLLAGVACFWAFRTRSKNLTSVTRVG